MDDGILTAVLNEIYTACGASGDILNNAKSLFIPLMTIDFVVVFIMQVLGLLIVIIFLLFFLNL